MKFTAIATMFLGLATAVSPSLTRAEEPATTASNQAPLSSGRYAYAVRGQQLAVIDSANLSVIKRVPLSGRIASTVVAHPRGEALYLLTDEAILILDPRSWSVRASVALANVRELAVDPDGRYLYASRVSDSPGALSVLSIIDSGSLAVLDLNLPNPSPASNIIVAPETDRLYLVNTAAGCCANSVTVIDTARLNVITDIELPVRGTAAVDPSGRWLYVPAIDEVIVLDLASNQIAAQIPLTESIFENVSASAIAFSPSGGLAYVAASRLGAGFGGTEGRVLVVDIATQQSVARIDLDLLPRSLLVNPSATRMYVAGQVAEIVGRPTQVRPAGVRVIDLSSLSVIADLPPLSTEPYFVQADALRLDPDNRLLYSTDASALYAYDNEDYRLVAELPAVSAYTVAPDLPTLAGDNFHFALGSRDGAVIAQQWGAPGDYSLPADYSGDGLADVAVLRPREGGQEALWYINNAANGATIRTQWGAVSAGDIPVPADYDGDGRADIAVWRPAIGEWFVIRSSDGLAQGTRFGTEPALPVPGDYDGDGRADFAVYEAGNWQVFGSVAGAITLQLGQGLDLPVPGDYDGDGRTDAAVYSSITGLWQIQRPDLSTARSLQWGGPGDIPVPADYDGDGRTDVAIWRPSTGTWWIIASAVGDIRSIQWGTPGDRPQPADYDGDGKADVAVHRP